MVWKQQYETGIAVVDEQHQELFERVGGFLEALRKAGAWNDKLPDIQKTMQFMQNYVAVHFSAEEVFQRKIGYPGQEKHHRVHEEFKAYVKECAQAFGQGKSTQQDVQRFAGKLLAWLVNHVVATDTQMAPYAEAAGGDAK